MIKTAFVAATAAIVTACGMIVVLIPPHQGVDYFTAVFDLFCAFTILSNDRSTTRRGF